MRGGAFGPRAATFPAAGGAPLLSCSRDRWLARDVTAAWMWARAELRARWRAWLLLGILAGVTVGVAAAGWAGARRTGRAVPAAVAASRVPDAALLANDPTSGSAQRAALAKLPGVTATYPFLV